MVENMLVRKAEVGDIPSLLDLNNLWLQQGRQGNTSKGFISGGFNEDDFSHMIADKMISVAIDDDRVAAYMLSMNYPTMAILSEHKAVADQIKSDGTVPPDSRIAIGVQTAVREQFHGTGLIIEVRKHFIELLRDRFDYLFTSISRQNQRSYKSATRFGWQVVGENEEHEHFFLIYKL